MASPTEVLAKIVEVWNARDRAAWMTACSPNVMVDREPTDAEGWGRYWDVLHAAFPNNRIDVTWSAEEADLAYFRVTLTGSQTGSLRLPPQKTNGKNVTCDFGGIVRVVDGKVLSLNACGIVAALMHQLAL